MVIVLSFLLAACASPFQARWSIEGFVRDSLAVNPAEKCSVYAVDVAQHHFRWARTQEDGSYHFSRLKPGKYVLGFCAQSSSRVEVIWTQVFSGETSHLDHTMGTVELAGDSMSSYLLSCTPKTGQVS